MKSYSMYRAVRELQKLNNPTTKRAVAYANGCAFANPQPLASEQQKENWAKRWLTYYDVDAHFADPTTTEQLQ